jgi:hypothetical protein
MEDYVMGAVSQWFGGVKTIQNFYVQANGSASTNEDAWYVDTAITPVSNISKCAINVQGMYVDGNATSWPVTARLTSTSNLRVSCRNGPGAGSSVPTRVQIIEYY